MFKYFNTLILLSVNGKRNRIIKFILVLNFILGIIPNLAFAQGHSHADAVTSATSKLGQEEVVITGRIICLGCHLKQKKQAKAQCSIYGHANAIIIEKAINPEGKHLAVAEGKIYQFLHSDLSDKLVKDHDFVGKIIVITGKIYPEANVLEIDFFKQKEGGR